MLTQPLFQVTNITDDFFRYEPMVGPDEYTAIAIEESDRAAIAMSSRCLSGLTQTDDSPSADRGIRHG